jgi:hypothetical protein
MDRRMSSPGIVDLRADVRGLAGSRFGAATLLLAIVAVGAVLTAVGLALLWLARNPLITGWDHLGHADTTLADATLARAHDWGALRDQLFLLDRFEPPGLRLLGLPVALLFWHSALTALRLSATACFVVTAGVLFLGLRRIAGAAGAAAAVLAVALAPVDITGAQNFMTEQVLLLCASIAVAMLAGELGAAELSPSGSGLVRLAVLGLALGWGTLTKLTFLPTIGILWLGVVAYLWWRTREGGALLLRLLLPGTLLLFLAWPHYALNGPRYFGYAHATAAGFGFAAWPERGIAFALRLVTTLVGDVFGPGGMVVLAAGLLLLGLSWRRAAAGARLFAALCVLASLPALAAFCFSRNQTDRYLALDTVLLGAAAAIGFGTALRATMSAGRVAVAVAAAAGLAQIGTAWAIAFGMPARSALLSGLAYASVRPNFACDYRALARITPPRDGPVRIGIFGETQAVNPNDVIYGYWHAGVPVQVVQFSNSSAASIDWGPVLADAAQVDYVILPIRVDGWYAGIATNRTRAEFRARLATVAQVTPMGEVATGPEPECRVTLLAVRPLPEAPPPRRPPLRPDTFIPGWTTAP